MTSAGGFVRGDATHGGRVGIGSYTVGFADSVGGCAYSATLGTTDASTAPTGRATVNDAGGSAGVQTYDAAGNPGLTAAGRRLLPDARSLLSHAEEFRNAGEEECGGLRGSLTVGCFRTAAPFLLPELLETFATEQPDVELDFIEGPSGELADALLEGRCEVALLYDRDLRAGIATEPVRTMRPYALMSPEHPLAGRASVGVDELAPHPMIMLDVPPSRDYYNDLFRLAGAEPNVHHYASSYELVRALVGRNLGWAPLLSRPQVDRSYEGLPLVQMSFHDDPLTNQLVLAWPAGIRLTRRARAFTHLCRRVVPAAE